MTGPNIFRFYNSARIYSPAARIRQQHTHGYSVKIPANSRGQMGLIFSRSVRKKNQNSFDVFVLGVQHLLGAAHIMEEKCRFYVQKYQMRILKKGIFYSPTRKHTNLDDLSDGNFPH